MEIQKRTFNNLMTHWIIPSSILPNINDFYEKILISPDNLQHFMKTLTDRYAQRAATDPEIESIFSEESYEIGFYGEAEQGVIWINIPNCERNLDCCAIAFPSVREKAGYYTCELSVNPNDGEIKFYLCEWRKIDEGGYEHFNYGEIDVENGKDFVEMVYDMIFTPQTDAKSYCSIGYDYLKAEDYDRAIDCFSKSIELKSDMTPYLLRGIAYSRINNYTQAIADLDIVIQLNVDELSAYYFRGCAYYNIGNYAQAINDFKKAIDLNPDFIEAHNQLKLAVDGLQKNTK